MIEVLIFGLSTNRGGIETYLYKIWSNIDHSKYHFSFIDITGENSYPCFYEELSEGGCNFFKITPRRVSASRNRKDLNDLFQKNHFDIFHYNVNTLSYLLPVEVALKAGCKVIIHSRNAGASNNILTRLFHLVNKSRLRKMDVTRIAVSYLAGKWLFGNSMYEVYHNGIDTKKFTFSCEDRERVRTEIGCGDKIVIGNVGAFLPAKNHKFMLDVFRTLKEMNNDVELWFVGDGEKRAEIEKNAKDLNVYDGVRFLGRRNDMPELYSAMDIFWLPSLYEGFPNAVLEAQCEGLPCFISDCIPQDVKILDNVFSLSLKASKEDWAKQMLETELQKENDRILSHIQIEQEGFSIHTEIERIEGLYQSLV